MSRRDSLLNCIEIAENELWEYDNFFSELSVGLKVKYLKYYDKDTTEVEVIEWDSDEGVVHVKLVDGSTRWVNMDYIKL